jgi:hypothetical protein
MANGSQAWRRFMEYLDSSRDAFGYDIRLGTTNEADLSAEYDYSPERYRVQLNGDRQNLQYNTVPEYEQLADGRLLKPQTAGDTVTLRTVERFRYVVGYVLNWSLAFRTNTTLTDGDVWAVGYGDPDLANATDDTPGPNADGWLVYQNSDHPDDTATIAEVRDGTPVDARDVTLAKLPRTWGRIAGRTNWYNVGVTEVSETDTADDTRADDNGSPGPIQRNRRLGTLGVTDGKGPTGGNQYITAEVKAGNSSSAGSLTLEVGSIGARTFGNVEETVKTKTAQIEGTTDTSGVWQPIFALRVAPDQRNVRTQLTVLDPVDFTGGEAGRVAAFVVDPALTDATNFTTPESHAERNSAVETTNDVTTFPDSTGAEVTTASNPGGYQVGFGSLQTSGSAGKNVTSTGRTKKRSVPAGEVAVVAGFSASTGTWTIQHQTEQDW